MTFIEEVVSPVQGTTPSPRQADTGLASPTRIFQNSPPRVAAPPPVDFYENASLTKIGMRPDEQRILWPVIAQTRLPRGFEVPFFENFRRVSFVTHLATTLSWGSMAVVTMSPATLAVVAAVTCGLALASIAVAAGALPFSADLATPEVWKEGTLTLISGATRRASCVGCIERSALWLAHAGAILAGWMVPSLGVAAIVMGITVGLIMMENEAFYGRAKSKTIGMLRVVVR